MVTIATTQRVYATLPALDRDILLAKALRKTKEFLYTHPEYQLTLREYLRIKYYFLLLRRGWPIAYITNHKEFFGLDFYVNRYVLIPRPETELLVTEAISEMKKSNAQKTALVDVGTGSGCIPAAIMQTVKNTNIKTYATDISYSALYVARRNARIHNVSITFLAGNLLQPLIKKGKKIFFNCEKIILTANLPYLTEKQFNSEPSIKAEPHHALVAGDTGTELYEKLLGQISELAFSFPKLSFSIFLEIDPSQTTRISSLVKQHLPTATAEIKPDLANRDRLVIIHLPNRIQ